MKKLLFTFLILPIYFFAQLKLEWKKDISEFENDYISGIIVDEKSVLIATSGGISQLNQDGQLVQFSPATAGIYMFQRHNYGLYTQGSNLLEKRDLNGKVASQFLLYKENGSFLSARNGRIMREHLYTTNHNRELLKYDLSGNRIFSKIIAEMSNNLFLQANGGNIYVYSVISNPDLGFRLMKYDTLGNQNWSISPGLFVYNIFADSDGYCYVLCAESGGTGYVKKFDFEGKLIYSSKLPGQCPKNAFTFGDSLFVCGQVSGASRIDGQKKSAFCIISAKNGETYYAQAIDMDPDPIVNEDFTQVASDGKAIYLGGVYGNEAKKCFIIKLSKEGNTSGLRNENGARSFNIFPNPGGSRFTITCDNPGSGKLSVTVRNSLGQVVQKKELPCEAQKSWELDLGKQAAGTYSVEIISGNEKVVKQLIVE